MPPDKYECQPEGWSDPPDEPDPEMHAQLWADRAPRGWIRCAGCGDQWASEDDHKCKCQDNDNETDTDRDAQEPS